LSQEPIAQLVVESLCRGVELGQYQLGSFVLMANHVHVLLLPSIPPSLLPKAIKGYTAREANRLLERTGEPFWQRESCDHSSMAACAARVIHRRDRCQVRNSQRSWGYRCGRRR
jgi:REP element-mobilizing transposase RayT